MADPVQTKWLKKRKLAADLIAAGEFDEALSLLKRRLGVINADPLEPLFRDAYWAACSSVPSLPQTPSLNWPLLAEGSIKGQGAVPVILHTKSMIIDRVKAAQKLTTEGKFADAMGVFRNALLMIPLSAASDATEEQNLLDIIEICRDYITFTRLEAARGQAMQASQHSRNIELAAYMTCVKVTSKIHKFLALQRATLTAFKLQNFVTAASFAKRIVQTDWSDQIKSEQVAKARQILATCEKTATDAHTINFDSTESDPIIKLCSSSFTRIGESEPVVKCPYCNAMYKAQYKGSLCETCRLCEIGANTLGTQLRPI